MTYRELYNSLITLGEFEMMVKPLNREVETEPKEKRTLTEDDYHYCEDCHACEVCSWYPHYGCEFKIAEPKTGEWIYVDNESVSELWSCSGCGQWSFGRTNYCPNCGADMRGKKSDD